MATTGKKSTATRTRRNGHNGSRKPPAIDGNAAAFFEAIGESTDAFFVASKAAADRAYRLSQAAINDVQAAQQDVLSLAEKWAKSPLDVLGWYTSVIDTAIHAQGRLAASSRLLWGELADAREETREALQRSLRANWRAGRAAFGLARSTVIKSS